MISNCVHIEKFLEVSRIEKNLTNKTLKIYRSDLSGFQSFIQGKSITELSVDDIRQYLVSLEQRNLKASTIKRKLATLKVFFSFMEDEELILISPTRKLKKKYRIPRHLPRVMSKREVKKLLKVCHEPVSVSSADGGLTNNYLKKFRDCVILEILFSTGIRINELVKINIDDIDLEQRTLLIFGKGRKERLLYLSSGEVIQSIKRYLEVRKDKNPITKALFINCFGNRLSVHSIGNIFKTYCNKAKIERKYTPHCLRHTMATMLMENGADVRSVQEILGHSSISTTEIYLEVSKQRKKVVFNKYNQRNQFNLLE